MKHNLSFALGVVWIVAVLPGIALGYTEADWIVSASAAGVLSVFFIAHWWVVKGEAPHLIQMENLPSRRPAQGFEHLNPYHSLRGRAQELHSERKSEINLFGPESRNRDSMALSMFARIESRMNRELLICQAPPKIRGKSFISEIMDSVGTYDIALENARASRSLRHRSFQFEKCLETMPTQRSLDEWISQGVGIKGEGKR